MTYEEDWGEIDRQRAETKEKETADPNFNPEKYGHYIVEDTSTFWTRTPQRVKQSLAYLKGQFNLGQAPIYRAAVGRKAFAGFEDVNKALSLVSTRKMEDLETQKNVESLMLVTPEPIEFLGSAANTLPIMIDTVKKSGFAAGLGIIIGGGITKTKEGAVLGAKVLGGAGTFANIATIEGTNTFLDLVEEGIDENLARKVSMISGSVSGLIETLELSLLGGAMQKTVAGNMTKGITGGLTKKYMELYVQKVGGEVVEENIQSLAEASAKIIARKAEGKIEDKDKSLTQLILEEADLGTTTEETIKAMSVLGFAPAAGVEIVRQVKGRDPQQQQAEPTPEGQAREQQIAEEITPEKATPEEVEVAPEDDPTVSQEFPKQNKEQQVTKEADKVIKKEKMKPEVRGRIDKLDSDIRANDKVAYELISHIEDRETQGKPTQALYNRLGKLMDAREQMVLEKQNILTQEQQEGAEVGRKRTILRGDQVQRMRNEADLKAVRSARKGFRQGVKAQKETSKSFKKELVSLIYEADITPAQRSAFLKTIAAEVNETQFRNKVEKILTRLEKLVDEKAKRQGLTALGKVFKKSQISRKTGKPVGKMDADTQRAMNSAREYAAMDEAQLEKTTESLWKMVDENYETNPEVAEMALSELSLMSIFGNLKNRSGQEAINAAKVAEEIYYEGRLRNREKAEARKTKAEEHIQDMLSKIKETKRGEKQFKRVKDFKTKLHNLLDAAFRDHVGFDELVEKLAPEVARAMPDALSFTRHLSNKKRQITKWAGKLREGIMDAIGAATEAEFQDYLSETSAIEEIEYTNTKGETVVGEYSISELRYLWTLFKNKDVKDSLRKSNEFTFEGDLQPGVPTLEHAVNEALSAEDKRVAEAILDFYDQYYDRVSPFFENKFGVPLPRIDEYVPIAREGESGLGPGKQAKSTYSRSPAAFFLRNKNAKGEIEVRDDVNTAVQHLDSVEQYINNEETVYYWSRILSNPETRKAVKSRYGANLGGKLLHALRIQIENISVGRSALTDSTGGFIRNFVKSFSVAKTAMKTTVLVKQLVSVFAALDPRFGVPVKAFGKHMSYALIHPKKVVNTLKDSALLQARGNAYLTELQRLAGTMEQVRKTKSASLMSFLTILGRTGDKGAIIYGGYSVYQHTLETTGSKVKAMEAFERWMEKTQQPIGPDQMSIIQHSKSPFTIMMRLFHSSQNAYFRRELQALDGLRNKTMPLEEFAKTMLIYHVVLPQIFQAVSSAMQGEGFDAEEQVQALLLGSFNGIFVMGDIAGWLMRVVSNEIFGTEVQEYPPGLPLYDSFMDLARVIKKIEPDSLTDMDFIQALLSPAELISSGITGVGLPLETAWNMATGVSDVATGKVAKGLLKVGGVTERSAEKITGGSKRSSSRSRGRRGRRRRSRR